MAKKNRQFVGQCIYCGRIAERHDDHIPPECFFPKPRPGTLITVPCCLKCNKDFGKDDEYVKTAIALILDAQETQRVQPVIEGAVRSLGRKEAPGFRAAVLRHMQRVMVKSRGGIYQPSWSFTVQADRIVNFGKRLIRGLYYVEMGRPLLEPCAIHVAIHDVCFELDLMHDMLDRPAKVIDDDVFAYRYAVDPEEQLVSAWILAFYKRFFISGVTAPPTMIVETKSPET